MGHHYYDTAIIIITHTHTRARPSHHIFDSNQDPDSPHMNNEQSMAFVQQAKTPWQHHPPKTKSCAPPSRLLESLIGPAAFMHAGWCSWVVVPQIIDSRASSILSFDRCKRCCITFYSKIEEFKDGSFWRLGWYYVHDYAAEGMMEE